MADGPRHNPPTIHYIDVRGLPAGFDAADLAEQGIDTESLVAWLRARRKPFDPAVGIPAPLSAVPDKPKPAPPEDGAGLESPPQPSPGKGNGKATRHRNEDAPPPEVIAGNVTALRKPEPEEDFGVPPEYSDDRLAAQMADKYAEKLAYVPNWGKWMVWDGGKWAADETLIASDLARRVCRQNSQHVARRIEEFKQKAAAIATKLCSRNTIANVETLAKSDRKLVATAKQWDADPWMLNTPAGIIDLRTGQLRPARRADYCSKTTRVAPTSPDDCPRWMAFLEESTGGDRALMLFLQRIAGYCLTGETREQIFCFFHGKGGNGKGTFLNTLTWLMADYATVADIALFTEQPFQRNTSGIASLHGARLVTSQEVRDGQRWDQQKITSYTGQDPIQAEFKYQNPFTFIPQFKLLFAGNNKPSLRTVDDAIRRRILLVPFTRKPETKDPMLGVKLQAEAAGILAWAIEGCMEWARHGLVPPPIVNATTEEYLEDEDIVGQFVSEYVTRERTASTPAIVFYRAYSAWCDVRREPALPMKRFAERMATYEFKSQKTSAGMEYVGIKLKLPSDYTGGAF